MGISLQSMPELKSPPIEILDEALMGEQCGIVSFHQPLSLESKVVICLAENDEECHLGQDATVTGGTLWRIEERLIFLDGLQLRRDGRAAIRDAEMVVQHIQEIPQTGALKGMLALARALLQRVQRFVESLVQVQLGRHAHAVA